MHFSNTLIESLEGVMPEEALSSEQIEAQLAPVYERLKLPAGRLELMTGIRERRFWPADTRPSEASAKAGAAALKAAGVQASEVDLLIHAGVCRDRLEPSTAAYVHGLLGCSQGTQILDISNACLGFLNALVMVAGLIDAGQIRRALIVSGENGRPLLEHTLRELQKPELTRKSIKPYFANLTIGSGAVAAVVSHASVAQKKLLRPLHAVVGSDSSANELCQGDAADMAGLQMQTDSEALMAAGVRLARGVWGNFKQESGWDEATPDRIVCHQVGIQHLRLLYEELGLDLAKDYSTYQRYGNTGSVALPVTLAEALKEGIVRPGDKVAALGIGSGLSCMMLALERCA